LARLLTDEIDYSIPLTVSSQSVFIGIYNAAGQLIRILVDGEKSPGFYSATWDGMDDDGRFLGNGVYFCRMKTGGYASMRKIVLIK